MSSHVLRPNVSPIAESKGSSPAQMFAAGIHKPIRVTDIFTRRNLVYVNAPIIVRRLPILK